MADLTLGALIDPATRERAETPVAVPAADLTTHGVIVGMTGSGKTGLGVVLIEECLSAGIPALLIDPKGDLTNLCLTFPGLSPAEFLPWVNPGDAQRAGVSVEEFAAQQAGAWRGGLADWGIGPERIAALRAGVDLTIYTPGSTAGVPLNIVGSLEAPADPGDLETMRDEVEGYVQGLLGLVGIAADPLSSREHILVANLIETSWVAGRDLDLPTLVGQVQAPPIRKLGVFDLDSFFPPADRTALAMRLNGLLASPAFAAWAQGPPLDVGALLRTPDGRPRCAILTTAHLSDEERQFVTTLVLARLVTWMRAQSGTTDLRALLYMDEVAGYVPPTAAPPTKKPIMTLMKQARAFGVGVVLATQNPVDIDYKAISNAGTWMIGRLQTERDKARLLDGMSAASGGVDVAAVGDTISGLGKRQFVLRRAGKDRPEVFTTRWAMSYLRGPLTRDQIAALMRPAAAPAPGGPAPAGAPVAAPAPAPAVPAAPPAAPAAHAADETAVMPAVADGVPVRWADPAAPWLAAVGADGTGSRLAAAAVARVHLRYDDTAADLVHDEEYEAVLFPLAELRDLTALVAADYDDRDLRPEPPPAPVYRIPGAPVAQRGHWTSLERDLADHLVRSRTLELPVNRPLKLFGRPGEGEAEFAARCREVADAKADDEIAGLRDRYEARFRALEGRVSDAQARRDELAGAVRDDSASDLLSAAGSVLGALLGGRREARRAARALGSRRTSGADVRRLQSAEEKAARLAGDLQELEDELADRIIAIETAWAAKASEVEVRPIRLEKSDVAVTQLVLAWLPVS